MTNLSVVGRGVYLQPYPAKHAWIGCVTTSPDKSDRGHDIVQSLPCHSPSEALALGRELLQMVRP